MSSSDTAILWKSSASDKSTLVETTTTATASSPLSLNGEKCHKNENGHVLLRSSPSSSSTSSSLYTIISGLSGGGGGNSGQSNGTNHRTHNSCGGWCDSFGDFLTRCCFHLLKSVNVKRCVASLTAISVVIIFYLAHYMDTSPIAG
jgi:hypothetical protein